MTSHTQGPWIAKEKANYSEPGHVVLWLDRSKGGIHQRRIDFQGCFTKADATLIATAPELLLALELCHMALIGYLPNHRNEITDKAIETAADIIAKARGEK